MCSTVTAKSKQGVCVNCARVYFALCIFILFDLASLRFLVSIDVYFQICHANHDLVLGKSPTFYCDCGSDDILKNKCKCLTAKSGIDVIHSQHLSTCEHLLFIVIYIYIVYAHIQTGVAILHSSV